MASLNQLYKTKNVQKNAGQELPICTLVVLEPSYKTNGGITLGIFSLLILLVF